MLIVNIPIKPLSVNAAWQGRRFKSPAYKQFERDAGVLLNIRHIKPIKGFVDIHYTFFIKNFGNTDIDNLIKPIQDIIVKAGIIEDDRKIVFLSAKKVKSKKANSISIIINPV